MVGWVFSQQAPQTQTAPNPRSPGGAHAGPQVSVVGVGGQVLQDQLHDLLMGRGSRTVCKEQLRTGHETSCRALVRDDKRVTTKRRAPLTWSIGTGTRCVPATGKMGGVVEPSGAVMKTCKGGGAEVGSVRLGAKQPHRTRAAAAAALPLLNPARACTRPLPRPPARPVRCSRSRIIVDRAGDRLLGCPLGVPAGVSAERALGVRRALARAHCATEQRRAGPPGSLACSLVP